MLSSLKWHSVVLWRTLNIKGRILPRVCERHQSIERTSNIIMLLVKKWGCSAFYPAASQEYIIFNRYESKKSVCLDFRSLILCNTSQDWEKIFKLLISLSKVKVIWTLSERVIYSQKKYRCIIFANVTFHLGQFR